MATFKDQSLILEYFKEIFGIGGAIVTPPTFYIGLLDDAGTEITSASYARQASASGSSNWPQFTATTGHGGDPLYGQLGVMNAAPFTWYIPLENEWSVRYVSIFDSPTVGVELFRIDTGSAMSFTNSIVIPAGSLVLSNEHIL